MRRNTTTAGDNRRQRVFSHVTASSANMAAAVERGGSTSVRKRRVENTRTEAKAADSSEEHGADTGRDSDKLRSPESLQNGTFWLTRIVLLRAVAFIYCKQVDA